MDRGASSGSSDFQAAPRQVGNLEVPTWVTLPHPGHLTPPHPIGHTPAPGQVPNSAN